MPNVTQHQRQSPARIQPSCFLCQHFFLRQVSSEEYFLKPSSNKNEADSSWVLLISRRPHCARNPIVILIVARFGYLNICFRGLCGERSGDTQSKFTEPKPPRSETTDIKLIGSAVSHHFVRCVGMLRCSVIACVMGKIPNHFVAFVIVPTAMREPTSACSNISLQYHFLDPFSLIWQSCLCR